MLLEMFFKKFNSDEYLELKQSFESLRISFEGLKLEFDLIRKKLKIKKGLEEEETKDIKSPVLLPEP